VLRRLGSADDVRLLGWRRVLLLGTTGQTDHTSESKASNNMSHFSPLPIFDASRCRLIRRHDNFERAFEFAASPQRDDHNLCVLSADGKMLVTLQLPAEKRDLLGVMGGATIGMEQIHVS
jgi:hypothetical protein